MRVPADLPPIHECPDEYLDGMEGHERARYRLAYALGCREQQLREALLVLREIQAGPPS